MTSLVVDPPTGRVPTLPEMTKARQANATPRADNFKERHFNERCLVHPAGPPMVGGGGLNPYLQIMQTRGYVMLYAEVANTARIIPTGKREHVPGHMHQWRGDSVGWWEGDTFVVETVNFRTGATLNGFGIVGAGMGVFTGPDFSLIERFSLAAPDVLLYDSPSRTRSSLRSPGPLVRRWRELMRGCSNMPATKGTTGWSSSCVGRGRRRRSSYRRNILPRGASASAFGWELLDHPEYSTGQCSVLGTPLLRAVGADILARVERRAAVGGHHERGRGSDRNRPRPFVWRVATHRSRHPALR
jgi:hypothetical protein